ncbi:MAG: antibiotic biosynthesis monooxygenase [Rhodobacteraceae bacterium]|nr:antibiotic biosynthesis monooxygenase [Paracoccaceae bacterium]
MIAVIFEVTPASGRMQDYLDIAGPLRTDLEKIEGFISVERFQSLTNPDKLLSVSFFDSEAAVQAWRNLASHREGQARGRSGLFASYRIRVAQVLRDYTLDERAEAPEDSNRHFNL